MVLGTAIESTIRDVVAFAQSILLDPSCLPYIYEVMIIVYVRAL